MPKLVTIVQNVVLHSMWVAIRNTTIYPKMITEIDEFVKVPCCEGRNVRYLVLFGAISAISISKF